MQKKRQGGRVERNTAREGDTGGGRGSETAGGKGKGG